MRYAICALIVVSFVFAIRHELRGKRVGLISAEFRGGLRLQVRPPSASSKIAVTCRPGGQAIAAEGYWFAPDRVRGPYEDGVALGSYPAESTDAPCGSS